MRAEGETSAVEATTSVADANTITVGSPEAQQTVPRQKSSWELIEQPVRGGEGAPGALTFAFPSQEG